MDFHEIHKRVDDGFEVAIRIAKDSIAAHKRAIKDLEEAIQKMDTCRATDYLSRGDTDEHNPQTTPEAVDRLKTALKTTKKDDEDAPELKT